MDYAASYQDCTVPSWIEVEQERADAIEKEAERRLDEYRSRVLADTEWVEEQIAEHPLPPRFTWNLVLGDPMLARMLFLAAIDPRVNAEAIRRAEIDIEREWDEQDKDNRRGDRYE